MPRPPKNTCRVPQRTAHVPLPEPGRKSGAPIGGPTATRLDPSSTHARATPAVSCPPRVVVQRLACMCCLAPIQAPQHQRRRATSQCCFAWGMQRPCRVRCPSPPVRSPSPLQLNQISRTITPTYAVMTRRSVKTRCSRLTGNLSGYSRHMALQLSWGSWGNTWREAQSSATSMGNPQRKLPPQAHAQCLLVLHCAQHTEPGHHWARPRAPMPERNASHAQV